jgi:hypothetical protein
MKISKTIFFLFKLEKKPITTSLGHFHSVDLIPEEHLQIFFVQYPNQKTLLFHEQVVIVNNHIKLISIYEIFVY